MQLTNGAWTGRRCFIIGGGPSCEGFDFRTLKGELTLGINMAFVHNPTVNLIYDLRLMEKLTVDPHWAAYRGPKLWLNSECPNERGRFKDVRELYESVHRVSGQPMWSASLEQGLYRGNNAGIAALNLADILGASPIYLLGYDFKGRRGYSANWHSSYPAEWRQEEAVYRSYADAFDTIRPSVRGRVINLNPDSGLRCFEFGAPEIVGMNGQKTVSIKAKQMNAVVVNGPEGFGDTIYMRAALRRLAESWEAVYVRTPWPQVFHDIPKIRPVRPHALFYRTQNVNVAAVDPGIWHYPAPGLPEKMAAYGLDHFRAGTNIMAAFMQTLRVSDPVDFSLKVDPSWEPEWLKDVPRPFGVVHPASVRREWMNPARNPRPEYLQAVIDSRPDVHWISVGFNVADVEWYEGGPLRGISRNFDKGELSPTQLLAVLARADMAVSAPCWMIPAAAALRTPHFCIFGGMMSPQLVLDKRMGHRTKTVSPVPFCNCLQNDHNCNKSISLGALMMEWGRFCDGLKEKVSA